MHDLTLRVVHQPRIFSLIHEGAELRDPETGGIYIIESIREAGAWTPFGQFLTQDRINSLEIVANGPDPKRAA